MDVLGQGSPDSSMTSSRLLGDESASKEEHSQRFQAKHAFWGPLFSPVCSSCPISF